MFDFEDPFEFGSWIENDLSSDIIDFVNRNKYHSVSVDEVDNMLQNIGVEYWQLPQSMKDKIDELDVY